MLFGVLGFGVCLRAYAVCMSFHPLRGWATCFEPFFLVPFLLAVNVLLLEIGVVSRRPGVGWLAMLAPLGLLLLAAARLTAVPAEIDFRQVLTERIGSPLCLTLAGSAAFYALALLRRAPGAIHWLTAALIAMAVVGPQTGSLLHLAPARAWPLGLAAALQLAAAIRLPSALHSVAAAGLLIATACVYDPNTFFVPFHGAIPLHLLLAAVLLVGAIFGDLVARWLQGCGAFLIVAACAASLAIDRQRLGNPPEMWLTFYPAAMVLVAVGYGLLVRNRWYHAAALLTVAAWLAANSPRGYRALREQVAGLDQIAWGAASLAVALAISLAKLGIPQKWLRWLWKRQ
jgi:hypothetical protein